jgi:NifU-like protein involved in Fe-S cluster formation
MTNEIITYYSKTPPNKFEMQNFSVKNAEENRNCADSMEVFLLIEDSKIKDFSFNGTTSIITTAAASVF